MQLRTLHATRTPDIEALILHDAQAGGQQARVAVKVQELLQQQAELPGEAHSVGLASLDHLPAAEASGELLWSKLCHLKKIAKKVAALIEMLESVQGR